MSSGTQEMWTQGILKPRNMESGNLETRKHGVWNIETRKCGVGEYTCKNLETRILGFRESTPQ